MQRVILKNYLRQVQSKFGSTEHQTDPVSEPNDILLQIINQISDADIWINLDQFILQILSFLNIKQSLACTELRFEQFFQLMVQVFKQNRQTQDTFFMGIAEDQLDVLLTFLEQVPLICWKNEQVSDFLKSVIANLFGLKPQELFSKIFNLKSELFINLISFIEGNKIDQQEISNLNLKTIIEKIQEHLSAVKRCFLGRTKRSQLYYIRFWKLINKTDEARESEQIKELILGLSQFVCLINLKCKNERFIDFLEPWAQVGAQKPSWFEGYEESIVIVLNTLIERHLHKIKKETLLRITLFQSSLISQALLLSLKNDKNLFLTIVRNICSHWASADLEVQFCKSYLSVLTKIFNFYFSISSIYLGQIVPLVEDLFREDWPGVRSTRLNLHKTYNDFGSEEMLLKGEKSNKIIQRDSLTRNRQQEALVIIGVYLLGLLQPHLPCKKDIHSIFAKLTLLLKANPGFTLKSAIFFSLKQMISHQSEELITYYYDELLSLLVSGIKKEKDLVLLEDLWSTLETLTIFFKYSFLRKGKLLSENFLIFIRLVHKGLTNVFDKLRFFKNNIFCESQFKKLSSLHSLPEFINDQFSKDPKSIVFSEADSPTSSFFQHLQLANRLISVMHQVVSMINFELDLGYLLFFKTLADSLSLFFSDFLAGFLKRFLYKLQNSKSLEEIEKLEKMVGQINSRFLLLVTMIMENFELKNTKNYKTLYRMIIEWSLSKHSVTSSELSFILFCLLNNFLSFEE